MADKKKDESVEVKSSGKLKWIILILIVLLLLAAGGGAAYYFLIYQSDDQAEEAGDGSEGAAAQRAEAIEQAPLIYHQLEGFTVNITAPGPARFLRVKMTVVTRDEAVVAALDKHTPMIRNDLLSLLASQEFATVNTPEGKDALREALKQSLISILTKAGEPAGVDEVLFTDFVMQ
ncbi:flagellar basal body-associated FliL family protein [Thiorhodococcus mannitoliphagus]|uniref:Flagellar protein FliL n=1 Tax=Thiorhodococcus mannitoliphagus TaxID=329406 RepID=A0A6P1DT56_9GAMM|nr:flagellar basal body-associated FliL family protein [Thiorhodococcus mannitoliphagus]NEX20121.1 flagellar basal body-associated FliL family protein [Thiorhodococcus mannitoliphagus]